MSLEYVLLLAFVGMLFMSALTSSETGLVAQFRNNKPALAIRMEQQMTVGKCFQVEVGGGPPCGQTLWQGPADN